MSIKITKKRLVRDEKCPKCDKQGSVKSTSYRSIVYEQQCTSKACDWGWKDGPKETKKSD